MTSGKFRILNNVVGTGANCVKPFDHRYACGANILVVKYHTIFPSIMMKNLPMYDVFYLITSH